MFGLDPLSRPVAIAEMLLLLALAALIGWLLGRWVRNGRVRALRTTLAARQAQLATPRPTGETVPSIPIPVAAAAAPPAPAPTVTPPVVTGSRPLRPEEATAPPPASPVVEPLPSRSPELVSRLPEEPGVAVPQRPAPVVEVPPVGAPIPEAPAFLTPGASAPGIDLPDVSPANRALPNTFLPGNTEAAVLNRIALRRDELNFDRIGRATAAEADDLKDIIGIGPFLERKLHSLGIYTYRQIANLTKEDGERVNEIIEFFPGRVERDNWVGQAKQFHERKYGARS